MQDKNNPNINKISVEEFVNFIQNFYLKEAGECGFNIEIGELKIKESYALWQEDVDRVLSHAIQNSDSLCEYKHAGFISYWLRRRQIITNINIDSSEHSKTISLEEHFESLPNSMKTYAQFYNELSAFRLGLRISFHYFIIKLKDIGSSKEEIESKINIIAKRVKEIEVDMSVFLKQKNISPHALYLIYKTIFTST